MSKENYNRTKNSEMSENNNFNFLDAIESLNTLYISEKNHLSYLIEKKAPLKMIDNSKYWLKYYEDKLNDYKKYFKKTQG